MATTSAPGERRSRGRPCKEPSGSPGTERRKQIREAQRAYRSRQQDLLSSLKERNTVLEEALDKINNIADSLHLVTTADVSLPRSRLVEAVQRIENEIRHRTKHALDASSTQDRPGHFFDFQEQVQYLLTPSPSEQSSASRMTPASTPTPAAPLSTSQQKSNFWSSFTQTSHLLIPNTTPRSTPTSDQISLGLSSDLSIQQPSIPIPYANTPFTQRLFRACAESGFRYLTNETVSDEEMWPQFGLMLQRMPRAEIIAYFRRVVASVPCNPLQDPRFPFLSLGGAGGHFNVRSPQGRPGLQFLWPLRAANGVVELQSEEEWFDVHDIEGFLVYQGLELTGAQNPPVNNALALYTPGAYGDILTVAASASASPFGGVPGASQGTGRWIKTINEDALVEALSGCCVCIGCAAGFLRRDVESFILQNTQWIPPTDPFLGASNN